MDEEAFISEMKLHHADFFNQFQRVVGLYKEAIVSMQGQLVQRRIYNLKTAEELWNDDCEWSIQVHSESNQDAEIFAQEYDTLLREIKLKTALVWDVQRWVMY